MNEIYRTYSASDMRSNPNTVLNMSQEEPIIIMQHTKPRAVLVSVEMWNEISRNLKNLREVVATYKEGISTSTDRTTDGD